MTKILVTNDDGIFSEGIKTLAAAMSDLGDVWVVAPDREQSASGHSLTLNRPLRMREIEDQWWAVDGTPTDCVNMAIMWMMKDDLPDLVVSGVNFGLNLGDDVTYSGTVSATFEGSLLGIPSIAFSQEVGSHFSFDRGGRLAAEIVRRILDDDLPEGLLLNVNFPADAPLGTRWTRLGQRRYEQVVVEKTDPRGRKYYWIAGTPEWQDEDGTDHAAISAGYVSITPLHLDLTDYETLAEATELRASLEGIDPTSD